MVLSLHRRFVSYFRALALLTWCGLPLGLGGSQLLSESQVQWSSAGSGTEARLAQSPTRIDENFWSSSISGPSSRLQALVESETSPEVCSPMPDAEGGVLSEECHGVQESRGAGTRSCARSRPARWQRGGQRNKRRKRATAGAEVRTGGVWARTPPIAHTGRSSGVSTWKVGSIAPGAKSCERDGIIKPLLESSTSFFRSALIFWSRTSKSTVPWSRIPTIASFREFSVAMVQSFLLQ